MQLTIAIPTFDRPDQLLRTVGALLNSPIPDNVEIVIVDNASQTPVEQLVLQSYPEASGIIRFFRNPSNIGLGANLLRCFEHARGNWTWLLGDDDTPLAGAVNLILTETHGATEDDLLIKFNSTNGGEVKEYRRLLNLKELAIRCSEPGFYSNLLFISSSVFRTRSVVDNLATGYHWNYTLAPHIAILLSTMSKLGSVHLVPLHIVDHGLAEPDQQWNTIRLATGFTALADIEGADQFRTQAMPCVIESYLGHCWLRSMIKAFFSANGRPSQFWRMHYLRIAAIYGGWTGFSITLTAWLLPLLKYIPFVRKYIGAKIKDHSTVCGLTRS